GLSLGGWMAAEVAALHPERVRTLTLVNAVGLYLKGAEVGEIFGRSFDELADTMFGDQSHPVVVGMRALAAAAEGDPASVPFDMIRPYLEAQAATAKIGWNPYLHDPKLAARLGWIKAPTLVIAGAKDLLVPRAHAEAYARGIPNARLAELPLGHMLTVESPDEVAALVMDHAAAHDPPG
ncbi:MAG TPA: alpha/beta hydrolase, partial [Acidimicrobiales bacterium]|nr:alpha/beta hydrolase [Acidimicrobiales bacterium]